MSLRSSPSPGKPLRYERLRRGNTVRYPGGFLARYLRYFVWQQMESHGWHQYEVAEWLGLPETALSEYLNRHAHPPPERRRLLLKLGCDEARLVEAEHADRLFAWMANHDLTTLEVRQLLGRIETETTERAPIGPESTNLAPAGVF